MYGMNNISMGYQDPMSRSFNFPSIQNVRNNSFGYYQNPYGDMNASYDVNMMMIQNHYQHQNLPRNIDYDGFNSIPSNCQQSNGNASLSRLNHSYPFGGQPFQRSSFRYTPYHNTNRFANTMSNQFYGNDSFNLSQSNQNNRLNFQHNQSLPPIGMASSTMTSLGLMKNQPMKDGYERNSMRSIISPKSSQIDGESSQCVTLQISNLDASMDENTLRHIFKTQLNQITPIISLVFENPTSAKMKVPNQQCAKNVVSHLHRRKIGQKRVVVAYTKDSSSADMSTLRCQIVGLLKDIPQYTISVNKFRELFQARFKTSINIFDLYKMHEICEIFPDANEEKILRLQPHVIHSIENSSLIEYLKYSVPFCAKHFKKGQNKGWAEQDIEPLPNVNMPLSQVRAILYPLLTQHDGEIPIATILSCIESELNIKIQPDDSGVNLEHLICCISGIHITNNTFGIKILNWCDSDAMLSRELNDETNSHWTNTSRYSKSNGHTDLSQICKEILELIKLSPKSTMKFNRFIPAYHNQFGKQCRVADYGYTRLIELFQALPGVIQVMGEGENRQVTLTHRTQVRRFSNDLQRLLRPSKTLLLSQLPKMYAQSFGRNFDITQYGVCKLSDMIDALLSENLIVVTPIKGGNDSILCLPKKGQSTVELEKTCIFAGEVVELFRKAPQYQIAFEKFVRSYHYHFGFQCRLSDYGFLKLADLIEAIRGIVSMEMIGQEERKIILSPKVALRVFAEQLQELTKIHTGCSYSLIRLQTILEMHNKIFGYQVQPSTLGYDTILDALNNINYVEIIEMDGHKYFKNHLDDPEFRLRSLCCCFILLQKEKYSMQFDEFLLTFSNAFNENITESLLETMRHVIQVNSQSSKDCDTNKCNTITLSPMMKYLIKIFKLVHSLGQINVADIKSTLNLGLTDCFEFGYPNVSSLLASFPDIFETTTGTIFNERSLVKIVKGCILTEDGMESLLNHLRRSDYVQPRRLESSSKSSLNESVLHDNHQFSKSANGSKKYRSDSIDSAYQSTFDPNKTIYTKYGSYFEDSSISHPYTEFDYHRPMTSTDTSVGNGRLPKLFSMESMNSTIHGFPSPPSVDKSITTSSPKMTLKELAEHRKEQEQFNSINPNVCNVKLGGKYLGLEASGKILSSHGRQNTRNLLSSLYEPPKPETPKSKLEIHLPELKLSAGGQSLKVSSPSVILVSPLVVDSDGNYNAKVFSFDN